MKIREFFTLSYERLNELDHYEKILTAFRDCLLVEFQNVGKNENYWKHV